MARGNIWKDHYTEKAREEKWLARSVYKLEEIDKKYRIIHRNSRILDLGCYPGSWSQFCIKRVGKGGEVVGLDLQRPERLCAKNFRFIEADILDLETGWLAQEAEKALEIALTVLKIKGHFLCKVFEGGDLKSFREGASRYFSRVRNVRPTAVRKRSREVYLLGLNLVK
jgi:23S rRNA (uridine2552-2'-O)-methyltransferase